MMMHGLTTPKFKIITQSAEMSLQMAATHPPVKGVVYLYTKVRVFLICMHMKQPVRVHSTHAHKNNM